MVPTLAPPANETNDSVPNSTHGAHKGLMEREAIPMEPYGTAMAEKGTENEPLSATQREVNHSQQVCLCKPNS